MNKIEKMIKELCPNGVEWEKLGNTNICIKTGKLNANEMQEGGVYPFFTCDKQVYRINTYAFDTEAILISGNGSQVGHLHYFKGKFNAYQRTYVLDNFENISVFFILHYFKAFLKDYIFSNSKKGSVPYITLPMLENFEIPVPPLPIQTEIVRILDKFVEQQEQLERLIELRKKQYEYYREELLKPKEGWETKTLGEICSDLYSGATPSTKIEKYWQNGTIPWMSSGEVNKGIVNKVDAFITQAGYDSCSTKIVPVGSVVIALAGQGKTRGTVALTQIELCTNQSLCALVPNLETTSGKYIFYYLRTQYSKLREVSAGDGNRGGLNLKMLKEYEINIPSLKIQNLIISKLDSFESSIAALTSALEASKRRYEYYMDKMLRF